MRYFFGIAFLVLSIIPTRAQEILNNENQILAATQIIPKNEQANATVWGYNAKGDMIVLRKGIGNFVCLSNNPNSKSFSVACYHKDLEPMMARGRALKKEGKNRKEIETIRAAESKAGTLKLPNHPSTLYVLYGQEAHFNKDSKKIENGHIRYVVYIPWATAKTTGLSPVPQVPGGPWIMFSGTYRAHIMITPPTK